MAHLSIRLLGPFTVELDGARLTGFRSDKVRALLAYLAVEAHRPWTRATLASLLWPDFPEKTAQSNLRNALSNLRHVIREEHAVHPYLIVSESTIQFNRKSDCSLDVKDFLDLVQTAALENEIQPDMINAAGLERALACYRGELLEGFSIASAPFEEWLLASRQQIRQKLLQALRLLVIAYMRSGNLATAEDISRRSIDLDPWDEAANRLLMQILTARGQRSAALAQFEACRDRLAEDLGIEPEPVTVRLYEQIRAGRTSLTGGDIFPEPERPEVDSTPTRLLPEFITGRQVEPERAVFVARKQELDRLESVLEKAIGGQGGVYFVTGEPGSGKTYLLAEFSHRAIQKHPDLVVAWGQCNAFTGQGDPYFPFLSITRMLAGDVEAPISAGTITPEQARRLWKFMPETVDSLIERAPDLVRLFISGQDLLSLARLHTGITAERFKRLRLLIKSLPEQPAQMRILQMALFEQFTRFLRSLAQRRPLVLFVDDLQWIDPGSVDLLFHLARQLAGAEILLLGAYRPEEVFIKREGETHPLAGILHELQAACGDIFIDLSRSQGGEFVEALLDSEPNELSREFRDLLYQRTNGNPLFTIELLRGMQLRGEIQRSKKGRWIEGHELNWDELPSRVEAVIARRIGHLPKEYREILEVASVEGEQFTAEIVARVLEKDEQRVCDLLSKEIGKQHRLVIPQGFKNYAGQRLSTYRFRHSLFQIYLYNHLDLLEKARLHEMVGCQLESLYSQEMESFPEAAHSLARHYEAAGVVEKAVPYYTRAGKIALRLSANRESIAHFYQALRLLNDLPPSEQRDRQELELQLSLGPPLTATKGWAPPEMAAAYERAQALCQVIRDNSQLIPALWQLAVYRIGRSEHAEVDRLVERLTRLAQQAGDPALLSLAKVQVSPFFQGKFSLAKDLLEKASVFSDLNQQIFLAQTYGMAPAVVGMAFLGNCLWALGFPERAWQSLLQACELADEVGHPLTACYAVGRSCWLHAIQGDTEAIQEPVEQQYQLSHKYGFKNFELAAVFFQSWAEVYTGKSTRQALERMHQSVEAQYATGTVLNQTGFLALFALACGKTGQIERGLQAADESIRLGKETGERWFEAEAYRVKGELLEQNAGSSERPEADLIEAENCYQAARQVAVQQKAKMFELRAVTSLCRLWQGQGKGQAGLGKLSEITGWFTEGWETNDLRSATDLLEELQK
jgi:predicted ATPase/DNA-binding SARP family transcriptional activator